MITSDLVRLKIASYDKGGKLVDFCEDFLDHAGIEYAEPKEHSERVAILAEAIAERTDHDPEKAFFHGLLHDVGKTKLPPPLFDGHNFNSEDEYTLVKTHAQVGFRTLENIDLPAALCAGLHHNVCSNGYGIPMEWIPASWSSGYIEDLLEMTTIVSISDFTSASTRKTKLHDGCQYGCDLKSILYGKFFHAHNFVDVAIECLQAIFPLQAETILNRKFE